MHRWHLDSRHERERNIVNFDKMHPSRCQGDWSYPVEQKTKHLYPYCCTYSKVKLKVRAYDLPDVPVNHKKNKRTQEIVEAAKNEETSAERGSEYIYSKSHKHFVAIVTTGSNSWWIIFGLLLGLVTLWFVLCCVEEIGTKSLTELGEKILREEGIRICSLWAFDFRPRSANSSSKYRSDRQTTLLVSVDCFLRSFRHLKKQIGRYTAPLWMSQCWSRCTADSPLSRIAKDSMETGEKSTENDADTH